EIPGLIEGASEDRGGGRALLGVLRNADAIVYCQGAAAPGDALAAVRGEVAIAGIELPAILAATKVDDAEPADIARLAGGFPGLELIPVSILDDASLGLLKDAIWRMTGLLRVYLRHAASIDDEPMAMPAGASTLDVAPAVHKNLAA